MYRQLLKDTSLYSVSTVLARGFSFITVPIFTRILSPSDYGALDLLSYAAMFIPLIFGLALDQAVARFFIDAEDGRKREIASTVILYYLGVLFLVALAAMPFSSYLAEHWLDNQVGKDTVMMVFVFMWVKSVYYAANNQLRYMFQSKKFSLCNIGNTTLSTILSILFIVVLRWGLFGLFLGQSISQIVFSALSLYYGRAYYALTFSMKRLGEMIRYSLPLIPSTTAYFGMQYANRFVLKEMGTLSDVGIYGIGDRLASIVTLFLMGFQGALYPLVIKHYANADAKRQFTEIFHSFVFIMTSSLVGISLFGKEILLVLTTERFTDGYVLVPILIASTILASTANYFVFGIEIRKKTLLKAYMNVGGFVINLLLNYCLISKFGLFGAAISTFVTFLLMTVIGMIMSQKLYYVPYNWRKVISTFVIGLGISSLILVYPFSFSIHTLLIKGVLCILTIAIFSELIQIVSIRGMWTFGYAFLLDHRKTRTDMLTKRSNISKL